MSFSSACACYMLCASHPPSFNLIIFDELLLLLLLLLYFHFLAIVPTLLIHILHVYKKIYVCMRRRPLCSCDTHHQMCSFRPSEAASVPPSIIRPSTTFRQAQKHSPCKVVRDIERAAVAPLLLVVIPCLITLLSVMLLCLMYV
jgi:hypothetical protein